MNGEAREHLLVYEPRVEGHHPSWLRMIIEDLALAGYALTLAADLRPPSRRVLDEHVGDLLARTRLLSAVNPAGKPCRGTVVRTVAHCLAESGASRAFLAALDEMASGTLRLAALGRFPAPELRGRLGGIYHRPRFIPARGWSPNRWLKARGFRALITRGWFRPVLVLDPYVATRLQATHPEAPIFGLLDPCPEDYQGDPQAARRALGIPASRLVLLFFGVGSPRKGLPVAVEAMRRAAETGAFLLVAGRQKSDATTRQALEALVQAGRATVLDRYVTPDEAKQCFQAADAVLLPYRRHFGISAVLAQAMAAQRPVIVSDEQTLGAMVRDHDLGLRFRSGDAADLALRIKEMAGLPESRWLHFKTRAADWAACHSRKAFRETLLAAMTAPACRQASPAESPEAGPPPTERFGNRERG